MIEARSGLHTVEEYVTKMRNRVEYLQQSEKRMISKIDRMSQIMERREQVILKKWEDQVSLQELHKLKQAEVKSKNNLVRSSLEVRQAARLKKGIDLM